MTKFYMIQILFIYVIFLWKSRLNNYTEKITITFFHHQTKHKTFPPMYIQSNRFDSNKANRTAKKANLNYSECVIN